jgi:hypothetical protein
MIWKLPLTFALICAALAPAISYASNNPQHRYGTAFLFVYLLVVEGLTAKLVLFA